MPRPASSHATRIACAFAAVVLLVALGLHASVWMRRGAIDWAVAANIGGLLVLMVTSAAAPRSRPLRIASGLVGLALILPSSFVLLARLA